MDPSFDITGGRCDLKAGYFGGVFDIDLDRGWPLIFGGKDAYRCIRRATENKLCRISVTVVLT
jgi:hypothetical protein